MSAPSGPWVLWKCPECGERLWDSDAICTGGVFSDRPMHVSVKAEEVEVIPVADSARTKEDFDRFVAALRRMAQIREDEGNRYIASCQRAAVDAAFEEIAEKPELMPIDDAVRKMEGVLAVHERHVELLVEERLKAEADFEGFKERLLSIAQDVEERGRATLKAGAARTGLFAEAAAIREAVAIASENPESTEEGATRGD